MVKKRCKCGCGQIVKPANEFIRGHNRIKLVDKEGRECNKCRKYKKWLYFSKSKKGIRGFDHWCKECRSTYNADHFRNSEKNNRLKCRFGITYGEYKRILKEQNNVCAICKRPEIARRNKKVKELAVDHCHDKKIIRGLLCSRCNMALGLLDDNTEILYTMIAYIKT